MRNLFCLIFLFASASSPAAAAEPTAIVSKDSLVFEIPLRDADAEWEWNRLPADSVEYQWVFDIVVPEPVTWPFSEPSVAHFGIMWESDGPPAVRGSVGQLVAGCRLYLWVTRDPRGRMPPSRGWGSGSRPTYDGESMRLSVESYFMVEMMSRLRPEQMNLRGVRADGSTYEETVVVQNLKDPREAKARAITGPFSPDEYAIYQTVTDHTFGVSFKPGQEVLILSPTVDAALFRTPSNLGEALRAQDDTIADFMDKRSVQTDLASLAALGHDVADAEAIHAERRANRSTSWTHTVRVSRIGFNAAGNQALLYCDYGGSNMGGKGDLFLLDKVDGEWRVTRRVNLWIA